VYFSLLNGYPNNILFLKESAKIKGSYSTTAIDPSIFKLPVKYGISYMMDINKLDLPAQTVPITINNFGLSMRKFMFYRTGD